MPGDFFEPPGISVEVDPGDLSVVLGVSLTGTLSENEMTGDREELVGRIDNSSLSNTSSRQAVNPPHFTSLGIIITPDQAIQSDPLVNLSITPSDKV